MLDFRNVESKIWIQVSIIFKFFLFAVVGDNDER